MYSFNEPFLPASLIGLDVAKMDNSLLMTHDGLIYQKKNDDWLKVESIERALDYARSEEHVIVATETGVFTRGANDHGQCALGKDLVIFPNL